VILEIPQHKILIGGIAKTKTKKFSLRLKTEIVNERHSIDRDSIRIDRFKKKMMNE
jgi:hypothetical protein